MQKQLFVAKQTILPTNLKYHSPQMGGLVLLLLLLFLPQQLLQLLQQMTNYLYHDDLKYIKIISIWIIQPGQLIPQFEPPDPLKQNRSNLRRILCKEKVIDANAVDDNILDSLSILDLRGHCTAMVGLLLLLRVMPCTCTAIFSARNTNLLAKKTISRKTVKGLAPPFETNSNSKCGVKVQFKMFLLDFKWF